MYLTTSPLSFSSLSYISSLLSLFWKQKVSLWNHHPLCPWIPSLINFRMPEPKFTKPGMCIIAREPKLNGKLHKSFPAFCVFGCVAPTVTTQRFGKNITAATNTRVKIEESLGASSSMRSVSYQWKAIIRSSSQNFLLYILFHCMLHMMISQC
jgi:hypothetical protein